MDKPLFIFGCGGHARSIISTVKRLEPHRVIILVDDNCEESELILSCATMREDEFWKQRESNFTYIIGIGDNAKRQLYNEKLEKAGGIAENIIAVSAIIGVDARVGKAIYVGEKAFVGPETMIGNNTIINTAAVVEHECKIGENVHIAPNTTICGRTFIGNNSFIGAGSIVIDKIKVTNNVVIGAGSVITKDILEPGIYVGSPARRIY